ncbi:response regulator [Aquimarina sp. 2201CG5-10]|uniref:ATP-binding response regulator n=1 Tax=Aquimarina callyspongiae TaxID=3098150 RepID=UPI002AB43AA7|nr:response regulator [Aquimarina sp. 2201CG5-10]MDY8137870.1 response regulator [Aquimarina sp. 2201CG5-10]
MKKVVFFFIGIISLTHINAQSSEISKDSITKLIGASFNITLKGEYNKAYEQLSYALEYGKKTNNDSIIGDAYNCMGVLFYEMKDLDKAEEYYKLSKEALLRANYRSYLVYYYNNMAIVHFDREDFKKAEKSYTKSRDLALELKDTYKALWPTFNIGEIKYKLKDFDSATFYLMEAIKLYQPNTGQQSDIIIKAHRYLGSIYTTKKSYNKALQNFKIADSLALKNDDYPELVRIEKARMIVYDELKQPEEAKRSLENQIAYLEKNFQKQQDLLKEKNQLEKELFEKESSLNLTKELNKSQNQSLQKIKYFSSALLILFFITVIVIILLYKSNKNRLKLNNRLQFKNKELLEANERIEYASQLKNNFFSTVSHELRTPLYAVTGITDILISERPKKEQVHYLNAMKSSGEHLLSLINNILQINKYDTNKIELNVIEFNVEEVINNIIHGLSYLKKENNNVIHVEIDDSIPKRLKGDSIKLSQIIINLLSNALKFTKNGNIWLYVNRVECDLESKEKVTLKICVKDDGIGISKQMQTRIFEDFYQESVKLNRNYEGVGLGLAIVKRLLFAMNGEIQVESKPNEGSCFSIILKFKCKKELIEKQKKNAHNKNKNLNNKTVLVVDDNKINQMITKRILKTGNANVVVIDNGFDAIEMVKNQDFDIVLMDIHMPKMNGYETTKKIRIFNKKIPIIALTAIDIGDNKKKISNAGMNGFISKPFEMEHFYIKLNEFLA